MLCFESSRPTVLRYKVEPDAVAANVTSNCACEQRVAKNCQRNGQCWLSKATEHDGTNLTRQYQPNKRRHVQDKEAAARDAREHDGKGSQTTGRMSKVHKSQA